MIDSEMTKSRDKRPFPPQSNLVKLKCLRSSIWMSILKYIYFYDPIWSYFSHSQKSNRRLEGHSNHTSVSINKVTFLGFIAPSQWGQSRTTGHILAKCQRHTILNMAQGLITVIRWRLPNCVAPNYIHMYDIPDFTPISPPTINGW